MLAKKVMEIITQIYIFASNLIVLYYGEKLIVLPFNASEYGQLFLSSSIHKLENKS